MPVYKCYRFTLNELTNRFFYRDQISAQTFKDDECHHSIDIRRNTKKWDKEFPSSNKITTRIWYDRYPEDVLCDIGNDVICYEREDNLYDFYVKQ